MLDDFEVYSHSKYPRKGKVQSHLHAAHQVLGLNSKPFSQTLGDSARLVASVLDTKDLWKLHYKNAKYL